MLFLLDLQTSVCVLVNYIQQRSIVTAIGHKSNFSFSIFNTFANDEMFCLCPSGVLLQTPSSNFRGIFACVKSRCRHELNNSSGGHDFIATRPSTLEFFFLSASADCIQSPGAIFSHGNSARTPLILPPTRVCLKA